MFFLPNLPRCVPPFGLLANHIILSNHHLLLIAHIHIRTYRMLNFTGAIRTGYGSTYGYGRGVVWLSQVDCQGNETNIGQCSFPGWGINNCYHYYDVNVVCDSESAKKLVIKLVILWTMR